LNLEKSGILNWIIEGFIKLYNGESDFDSCDAVTARTEDYREESDDFTAFLEETCDRYKKPRGTKGAPKDYIPDDYKTPTHELYEIYYFWSKANGIRIPLTERKSLRNC